MRQYDLAVVGAGVAGLAAAALVASTGHRVVVLESRTYPGGRAHSTDNTAFQINFGPRALYRANCHRLLRRLGVPVPGGRPPSAAALALYEGQAHTGFMSLRGLARTPLLSPPDRASLARMLLAVKPADGASMTTDQWLRARAASPRLRLAVLALARVATYELEPEIGNAGAVTGQLAAARSGVRYVDGGWQTLVNGLVQACTARRVDVRLGQRVRQIEPDGYGYLVHAGATTVATRTLLIAGLPPARTFGLLSRPVPAGVGTPVHAACLDVALRRLPNRRHLFLYGMDEPVYLVVHSAGARLAPHGGAVLHAVRYLGAGADPGSCRDHLEALLDRYQPGWREHVSHERFLPRMVVANASVNSSTGLLGRPPTAVAGLPGVYVAGDWVGPQGLLADAAAASAEQAAISIQARLAAP